jgi:acyl-CoA thioester hydrolase
MTQRFTRRFRVRHGELDALGHVNNVAHVAYMQEAAIEASAHAGFTAAWYRERGTGWVVRRLTVRYLAPAGYGDELDLTTWVSALRGVRSTREYDLTRVGDGARVARGRAEWVYVDRATGQPARLPAEFRKGFAPGGHAEDLEVRAGRARPTEGAHRYASRRRVQFHEVDTAWHASHLAYLEWVGQAYFEAIRAAGYPLGRMLREGWLVLQVGHNMEYLAPALEDDPIEVVSWVREVGRVRGAWTHEVYHAGTGKLLARDYSLGVFVTADGRPTAPPPGAIEAVLRGPGG